jgi:hypothetical protein
MLKNSGGDIEKRRQAETTTADQTVHHLKHSCGVYIARKVDDPRRSSQESGIPLYSTPS